MRRLLIAPLVLPLAYLGWPLTAAWQLRAAVKGNDIPAIESKGCGSRAAHGGVRR